MRKTTSKLLPIQLDDHCFQIAKHKVLRPKATGNACMKLLRSIWRWSVAACDKLSTAM